MMRIAPPKPWHRIAATAGLGVALAMSGCGTPRYPVSGTISYDDGSAYTGGGIVVLEGVVDGKAVMTRASIRPDGTFITNPGRSGGAFAGRYRIRLIPPPPRLPPPPEDVAAPEDARPVVVDEANTPLAFDKKFLKFETSGLEWTVGRGSDGQPFAIKLGTRPSSGR
jgi:hypothetical protein